jgi:hypothetical protein
MIEINKKKKRWHVFLYFDPIVFKVYISYIKSCFIYILIPYI